MKKTLLLIFATILITFSCKKKETAAPAPVVNATTGTPVLQGDNGTFSSNYNTTQYANVFYLDSSVNATFYESQTVGAAYVTAGTVSINANRTFVKTIYLKP